MRRSMFTVIVGVLALLIPAAAEAKSYNGDGSKLKNRSVTSRSNAKNSGSASSCLTSDVPRAFSGEVAAGSS